jgi:hypothetical protein
MPKWDPRIVWYGLSLAGILLLGALVIWLVDRWRKKAPQQELYNSGDQLTHFRKLYEQGELSAEEFARIRNLLTDRMMRELNKPDADAEHTPDPPPAPPPPRPEGGGPARRHDDDPKPAPPPTDGPAA